jgi:hypothetical protein
VAISYVGGITSTFAGATNGTQSISLTALTGGSGSTAAIGDIVIVTYSTGSTVDRALTVNTAGYLDAATEQYANGSSFDTNFHVFYKKLTSAETTVVVDSTGNNSDAGAVAVQVFRGVDSATQLDVASTVATGTATGRPNPASITPTTNGAWIVVCYGSAATTGATYTAPGDVTNFITATSSDTNDAMVGMGTKTNWASGAFDPAAVSAGGTTGAGDSWAAVTVVLRPTLISDSVTPGSYSVTGSAANLLIGRKVTATGGSYSVTGAAANFIIGKKVIPVSGTFTVTGSAANLLVGRKASLTPGSYSYTGTPTNSQTRKVTIGATPGSYATTGTNTIKQLVARKTSMTPGSYSYTGTATNSQTRKVTLPATPASYSYTGTNTTAQLVGRKTSLTPGSYSQTGIAATLTKGYRVSATPGTYVISGVNPSLRKTWRVTATPGTYVVSGTNTTKQFRGILMASTSGSYAITFDTVGDFVPYKPTLLMVI